MSIQFKNEASNTEQEILINTIEKAVEISQNFIPLRDVSFSIEFDEQQVIPEWGVGGYCENDSLVEIAVEKNRENDWKQFLPRTVFHEWHHLARWRGIGYGKALLEVMISEGLAQHFEVEVDKGNPSFFSQFLTSEQRNNMFACLKNEYRDPSFDHSRWFFGKGEFPFQGGYDLSFYITGMYMTETKAKPSQLIDLTAEKMATFLDF
ncbi:MAG: DUF2268 domain-containing putative Zn-dependent protease [Bacteriovoracaceae bacterium]|jgi:uncharacterized protein YjaZ|nr:DUF2268 domain-containing putative Zn-dependent protease [Bacteriovoracaceae bacterium]